MAESIEIRNLYKIFGPRGAELVETVKGGITKAELNDRHHHVLGLKNINIAMPGGYITVVMGLSGSGKSTLIRHLNRLIEPTAGEVLVDGVDVCRMSPAELRAFRRTRTAMVFQKFALLPHRTVVENTAYGLGIQGIDRSTARIRAREWIERVGLAGFEDHYPHQLSGGMQQRVGLARALATDAGILLMDEAFSALDPLIRVDMQTMLLELQRDLKKTVVFITHDLDEALRLGDRIAILRDGEVVQQGTGQDIVLAPADAYISAFVSEVNRGRVLQAGSVMKPLEPPSPAPHGISVPADSVLEDAARQMLAAGVGVASVTDATGRPVGTIDMASIVTAMVTPVGDLPRPA
ncbi:MAG: glycine betaine/L-proline ABC transporter ATP-binding protein [Rhizobium sp.]|nr:glycine betaine/L-proline ABC transporter ATP-binding protein [Rhizobium sp.]